MDTDIEDNETEQEKFNSVVNTEQPKKEYINKDAVNQINSILGISKFTNLAHFDDVVTTPANTIANISNGQLDNNFDSSFRPQIIIGKGASDATSSEWNTSFKNDSMTFNNTMAPTHNLWGSDSYDNSAPNTSPNRSDNKANMQNNTQKHNDEENNSNDMWTQSLNDYNNGKWDPKKYRKASDYNNTLPHNGTPTPTSTLQSKKPNSQTHTQQSSNTTKKCGEYTELSNDNNGNLIISNYTEAKKWHPGYTYLPPILWDVPQKRASICQPNEKNYTKLTGIMDRGLPMNVLELNQSGNIADTEDTVSLTNVGSIMPISNMQELPFSKPYV